MTEPSLARYGREINSVFDLLGRNEVDLTAALGWTLAQSPRLMVALWSWLGCDGDASDVDISLEVADEVGRTDLELTAADTKVVIEAKKGWLVPGDQQLAAYVARLDLFLHRRLVSLSDSSAEWAAIQLPSEVLGVPVTHLPWDNVREWLAASTAGSRGDERVWLQQLTIYLAGATSVRDRDDQWVYCVVLSDGRPGNGGPYTYREFVTDARVYYHPFGPNNGWPYRPPRFLAFRWGGRVRQVNRVVKSEPVPNLQARWPNLPVVPGETDYPHIIHSLGPDIPIPTISTQGTYATARVWTLLDQLLVQPTLKDAFWASKALTEDSGDTSRASV